MKKTSKWNKIVNESQGASLKDIESSYGKDVALALVKYCKEKDKDMEKVINDLNPDKFGLTEWDWFEKWSKRTLNLDIYGGFSDDWKDELDSDAEKNKDEDDEKEKRKKVKSAKRMARRASRGLKVHSSPSRSDYMTEGSGSRYGEQDIIDYIGSSIYGCEWVKDTTFDDYDPILVIETTDGDKFEISVKKMNGQNSNGKKD